MNQIISISVFFHTFNPKFSYMKKNKLDDNGLNNFENRSPDFIRLQNDLDTPKFRQEFRKSSQWSLVISIVAIAIAFTSLMVSIFK